MILSGLYGILIVVLGAVIPLTEIFAKDEGAVFEVSEYVHHTSLPQQAFYLYSVSITFLV